MPNVYIDASGTGGSLKSRDDQRFFVVAAVFLDSIEAENKFLMEHSEELKKLPPSQKEFKSTKNPKANRWFLDRMLRLESWAFGATIGWKQFLYQPHVAPSAKCQRFFIKQLLVKLLPALNDGIVLIDKTGSKLENQNLLESLKRDEKLCNTQAIKDSNVMDSTECGGIQLADVIAGIIADMYDTGADVPSELLLRLRKKELVRWEYPFDSRDRESDYLTDYQLFVQPSLDFYGDKEN